MPVGTDHHTWEGVIGSKGISKCNSNGLLLLRTCTEHDLLITNTVFRLPNRNKTSWMHPRSKQYVRVTKTMYRADCWIDHSLDVSKLNLRIQPTQRPQGKKAPKRLDVSKLYQQETDICNHLGPVQLSSEDPEENWTVFRNTVHSLTVDTLGYASRKHLTGADPARVHWVHLHPSPLVSKNMFIVLSMLGAS